MLTAKSKSANGSHSLTVEGVAHVEGSSFHVTINALMGKLIALGHAGKLLEVEADGADVTLVREIG